MKWIGIVLVLTTTTLIGFGYAKKYRERPRQLSQLINALQSLEAEIMYGLSPIKEVADHLSHQLAAPIRYFFITLIKGLNEKDGRSLSVIWNEAVESYWPRTALKATEKEIWKQFGQTLGQTDRDNQKKFIKLAISQLEHEEKEARLAQQQYEKMAKSLGVLGGILIVLLLF